MADDPDQAGGDERTNRDSPMADDIPISGDEALEAMKEYQRQVAAKMIAAQAEKVEAATPVAGGPDDDNSPETSQRGGNINDASAAEFAEMKAKYLRKKAAGKNNDEMDIKFLKAQSAEKARQKKLRWDAEVVRPSFEDSGDDEPLFVSSIPDLPGQDSDAEEQPKKRRRKSKRAQEMESEDDAEPPKKRAKKTATGGKKGLKVSGQDYTKDDFSNILHEGKQAKKTESKAAKAAKPKPPGRKKKPGNDGHSMTNIGSVWGTNIFKEAAANEGARDQPTFSGDFSRSKGKRSDAVKQLIASVPTEARNIANHDRKYLEAAFKHFAGVGSVKAAGDGNWSLRGMKTTLKSYQILGIAFMRERETGSELPKGGIMADGMGLGKTLMTLANIVNGRPPKGKGKLKTTLIVASPALVNQWFQEIQTHCKSKKESKENGMGGVYQHRAGHRLDSNNDEETLRNAEIILTTYSEVNRSYPKAIIPDDLVTAKQKDEWWKDYYEKNRGLLHRMKFLRVVLDEAQQIKNHKSVSSMACRALDARHHWALTGTPLYNSVTDFYSLFKFVREPHTGTFHIFKQNFVDPQDPYCLEKLNVFLRKLMVRRTHSDRLFGAKLLDLPSPSERTVYLEFDQIERQVYEIVKTRMISRINCIAKQEGPQGLQKKFSHIWTMMLRLRQLCGHILLIQGTILDVLEREDFSRLNHITAAEHELNDEGIALMVHLKRTLASRAGLSTVDSATGATISETQILSTGTVDIGDIDGDIGGKHGQEFRFKRYLKHLAQSDKWTEITERSCCVACRQVAVNPYISDCYHIYCLQCLTDMQHQAARRGWDSARCAECGAHYTDASPCDGLEELANESPSLSPTDTQTTAPKKRKKKATDDEDWIDLPGDLLPSAKTRAAKSQVLAWLEEDDKAKIIIYTQFIPMVKILEKICKGEKWDYCKYTGNMSQDARNNAINEFGKNKDKKILLASLKAGGLGLNLTMASRVLLLDPWWNSAVEQQAFARVYRIGQKSETKLTRLVITNTIDAAMMAVKARKDEDIEAVMNDAKRKETLDVKDLMRLFGEVREDGDGKPFIFAQGADDDEDDEPEHLRLPAMDPDDEDGFMGNEE